MNWSQSTKYASSNKNGAPKKIRWIPYQRLNCDKQSEIAGKWYALEYTKNYFETNRSKLLASDPK